MFLIPHLRPLWRHRVRTSLKQVGLVALAAVLAASCSIATEDLAVTRLGAVPAAATATTDSAGSSTTAEMAALPILGPVPAASHWHAAYVVRICDDVLDPFGSTDDPLGIHSHSDGLMHIHPFFAESGYESATLGLFADAMGLGLSDGALTLPSGGTWRDGDMCNGVPGRVFVDRWEGPSPTSGIERIFTDLDGIRYLADGELYQIAFAPVDSPPVVPPAINLLGEVSNLGPAPDPWIDVEPARTLAEVQIWKVGGVAPDPCGVDGVPESVLSGVVRCFVPATDPVQGADAIRSARAVIVNRRPAIDLRIEAPMQQLIAEHFGSSGDPLAIAIQVGDVVITAPQIVRPPASPDRLVVSGGFSIETAQQVAAILNGDT